MKFIVVVVVDDDGECNFGFRFEEELSILVTGSGR